MFTKVIGLTKIEIEKLTCQKKYSELILNKEYLTSRRISSTFECYCQSF